MISALGPTLSRGATGTPLTGGTRRIVEAMKAAGVRRFIGLATPAVADRLDRPTVRGKLLGLLPRLFLRNALTELVGMTEAVTGSDLDWKIARITAPTDKPATGRIRAGFLGRVKVGWTMSRADVAAFLVGQLTDDTYHRPRPPSATERRAATRRERSAIFVVLVIATVLLAVICASSAAAKLRKDERTIAVIGGTVGVPLRFFPVLAALELAGAAGILLGLWLAPLGVAAAAGLVAYFVGAAVGHLRAGDTKGLTMPVLPLVLSVAVLALRLATL